MCHICHLCTLRTGQIADLGTDEIWIIYDIQRGEVAIPTVIQQSLVRFRPLLSLRHTLLVPQLSNNLDWQSAMYWPLRGDTG
jgi:hypothetical protein